MRDVSLLVLSPPSPQCPTQNSLAYISFLPRLQGVARRAGGEGEEI